MTTNTFPKSSRLLNSKDYGQVFSAVDYRVSDRSILMLAKSNSHDSPRLGIIVAKKHQKRAVDRNKTKRFIRESFRIRSGSLPNIDVVVLARDGIRSSQDSDLQASLEKLWRKLAKKADVTSASS